ncbi:hypothetical protein BJI67_16190 (plasmid) [Acidihalobacter aeolianus]|uniref:Uncharacterized protein n=1 Tax=Acidihalobacter aeolianus TaxID=2792603 RepID=A0A1D8KCU4_9GAMM|nr:hypothetical protein BJI67_16190 [Acidihalobacter aeolianus]
MNHTLFLDNRLPGQDEQEEVYGISTRELRAIMRDSERLETVEAAKSYLDQIRGASTPPPDLLQ